MKMCYFVRAGYIFKFDQLHQYEIFFGRAGRKKQGKTLNSSNIVTPQQARLGALLYNLYMLDFR